MVNEKNFDLQIARELGSIDSRLTAIEELLAQHTKSFDNTWQNISGQRRDIDVLKVKIYFMSAVISSAVALVPKLIGLFI